MAATGPAATAGGGDGGDYHSRLLAEIIGADLVALQAKASALLDESLAVCDDIWELEQEFLDSDIESVSIGLIHQIADLKTRARDYSRRSGDAWVELSKALVKRLRPDVREPEAELRRTRDSHLGRTTSAAPPVSAVAPSNPPGTPATPATPMTPFNPFTTTTPFLTGPPGTANGGGTPRPPPSDDRFRDEIRKRYLKLAYHHLAQRRRVAEDETTVESKAASHMAERLAGLHLPKKDNRGDTWDTDSESSGSFKSCSDEVPPPDN